MIGLKLPKLFYGRRRSQQVIGQRAEFCEFCFCICRHQVISFRVIATVFFVPLSNEETHRESCCEVCRTQFPMSLAAEFNRGLSSPAIYELIQETNPGLLEAATRESEQIIKRSGGAELIRKNRFINFIVRHEEVYKHLTRNFVPLLAIGSIQAVIIGLILSYVVTPWLAYPFALSVLVLVALCFFWALRQKVDRVFGVSLARFQGVANWEANEMEAMLQANRDRCPNACRVLRRNMERNLEPIRFEQDRDFVSLLK